MPSRKNGDRTGAFLCIDGTECARTILNGGAKECAAPDESFIFSGLITSRDFIASTRAPGGLIEIGNSCPSTSIKCSNEPAAAHRILVLAMTTHPKTGKRINAK